MTNDKARPLTPEETAETMKKFHASIESHGWWNKVCIHCGGSCGGMLAEYGKPRLEDLEHVVCPECYTPQENYHGKDHIRLEFMS